MDNNFYKNKKVLLTGHTGFKGSWMCMALAFLGAEVTGYSLAPQEGSSLFGICDISEKVNSVIREPEKGVSWHRARNCHPYGGTAIGTRVV